MEVISGFNIPYRPGLPGERVKWPDGREFVWAYYDVSDPAAAHIQAGSVVMLYQDVGGTNNYDPKVAAVTSAGILVEEHCVTLAALTAAGWYWFQTKGLCTAKVEGTVAITIGDFLKPVNGQDYLVLDHATVRTLSGMAKATTAYAVAAESTAVVNLLGLGKR